MQKAIFVSAVWAILLFFAYFLYRNRMSPKVLETCVTILLLAAAVIVWQLKSEKLEKKISFVYFFDHKNGKFVDLTVPGLYHPEKHITSGCEELLKVKLKSDFMDVSTYLAEYVVFKYLNWTPFGANYYGPTKRIPHLGIYSGPGHSELDKKVKVKFLKKDEILKSLTDNIFTDHLENNNMFSHLKLSEIKLPSKTKYFIKRNLDKKGKLVETVIRFEKALWFNLEIKIRGSVGGIIGNWTWAKKNLQLANRDDSYINNYYDSTGEIQVVWELKEWSIGHPNADLYRKWLTAISERLQNHFDWNLKSQTLHIETPYIQDTKI